MTPTHEPFRTIHPSLQLTPTIRYLQLKLEGFPNLFSGPFFNDSGTSPALIFTLPVLRLCPDLRIFIIMEMANFLMDDTVSSYLSLIHNSKPDTDVC